MSGGRIIGGRVSGWLWRWGLPVLAIALVVHAAVLLAVPRIIMHIVLDRLQAVAAVNTPLHTPPVDAAARLVPLPSPDLLYSSCALNLAAAPVLVSVTPGAAYLSLAVFDMRSDNVYVANDGQAAGRPLRLLITGPGQDVAPPPGVAAVRLTTPRGLLLVRGLAATPGMARVSEAARRTLSCRRLPAAAAPTAPGPAAAGPSP